MTFWATMLPEVKTSPPRILQIQTALQDVMNIMKASFFAGIVCNSFISVSTLFNRKVEIFFIMNRFLTIST